MAEIPAPFISEHQGPGDANGTTPGYKPTPEEKKILELVDSLYGKAKKYRKRYDQKWIDYYKMFRSRQWKEVRPSYRHSEVINLVFQTIQSMVPILTDSRPKLEFLPTLPTQFELADILNKVAENDWTHNNWLMILTEIIYDAHFYGTGIGHLYFDPEASQGLGNVCFESEDPVYCFPEPNARDINEKRCRHFIVAEPVDVALLKKQYPDKAQYIAADVIDFSQGDKQDIFQVMFKSPVDSKLIVEGPSGYDLIAKNQALKITVYFRDDDIEEEEQVELKEDGTPELDSEGNPKKSFLKKLKYPNGRKIVIGGGVLLENGELDADERQFPYLKLINYILPREFWGMGEVESIEGPQKTFNKIVSFAMDVMTLMGNPIWVVDDTAGIDTDNLFNKPGLIVEKTAGSEVRRETGVELQPFVLQLLDRYKQYIDNVSGETDMSRGVEPRDVTAASAISALQEAQQTRLRQKSRNIDVFLQQFGKLYLNYVFNHYSVPRIVRVTGDANAQEFFHFHVEELEDGTKVANITDSAGNTKKIEIVSDFDVKVSTGTTLPFAKSEKQNMSFDLFKMGVIDAEELLKNLDYPNYEAVLQRVQAQKQQQMQQQMQMQQGQMGQQIQAKQALQSGKVQAETQGKAALMDHQVQLELAVENHRLGQQQAAMQAVPAQGAPQQ